MHKKKKVGKNLSPPRLKPLGWYFEEVADSFVKPKMRSKAALISWESRQLCFRGSIFYQSSILDYNTADCPGLPQNKKYLRFYVVTYWHQKCFPLAPTCFAAWNGSEVIWDHQQMSTNPKGEMIVPPHHLCNVTNRFDYIQWINRALAIKTEEMRLNYCHAEKLMGAL